MIYVSRLAEPQFTGKEQAHNMVSLMTCVTPPEYWTYKARRKEKHFYEIATYVDNEDLRQVSSRFQLDPNKLKQARIQIEPLADKAFRYSLMQGDELLWSGQFLNVRRMDPWATCQPVLRRGRFFSPAKDGQSSTFLEWEKDEAVCAADHQLLSPVGKSWQVEYGLDHQNVFTLGLVAWLSRPGVHVRKKVLNTETNNWAHNLSYMIGNWKGEGEQRLRLPSTIGEEARFQVTPYQVTEANITLENPQLIRVHMKYDRKIRVGNNVFSDEDTFLLDIDGPRFQVRATEGGAPLSNGRCHFSRTCQHIRDLGERGILTAEITIDGQQLKVLRRLITPRGVVVFSSNEVYQRQ